MRVYINPEINEIIQRVCDAKNVPGPAAILNSVKGHKVNPDGSGEILIADGYTEKDLAIELQRFVSTYAAALSLPMGEFSIWLTDELETGTAILSDTIEGSINEARTIADMTAKLTPYIAPAVTVIFIFLGIREIRKLL